MAKKLRTSRVGDPGWIISKHGEIYSAEFGFDGSFEINIADKFVNYFASEHVFNSVWIAEVDGERAGSIAVREIAPNIAFINFVLVLDSFRGHGLAKELMEKAVQHSRDHGYELIRLETFDCLVAARDIYRNMGFEIAEAPKEIDQFGLRLVQEFWELEL